MGKIKTEIIDFWITPEYRLNHILSNDESIIEFVRDGSHYFCDNKSCDHHSLTYFNKALNRRCFQNGYGLELDKYQIKSFNISKYCEGCRNMDNILK